MDLVWTEKDYGTGVPQIDLQHQKLFEMVNCLFEALADGTGMLEIAKSIDRLKSYFVEHFRCFDDLEEQRGCRASGLCLTRKQAHAQFLLKLEALTERLEFDGTSVDLSIELYTTTRWWLDSHIRKVNAQLKSGVAAR